MARFIAIYGFTGLACARGWQDAVLLGFDLIPAVITLSTILGVGACLVLIFYAVRHLRNAGEENVRFVHFVAAFVAAAGAVAMLFETAPVLFLAECAA
jgi:hypothetical protein